MKNGVCSHRKTNVSRDITPASDAPPGPNFPCQRPHPYSHLSPLFPTPHPYSLLTPIPTSPLFPPLTPIPCQRPHLQAMRPPALIFPVNDLTHCTALPARSIAGGGGVHLGGEDAKARAAEGAALLLCCGVRLQMQQRVLKGILNM